jgi:hypothetical protein
MSENLQDRMHHLKREALLGRIASVAQHDVGRWVPIGLLGQQMGLPYGEALTLADELREAGFIERGGGGRLEAPVGPRVHLLPAGIEHVARMASAEQDRAA